MSNAPAPEEAPSLGAHLKSLRELRGLTQAQLLELGRVAGQSGWSSVPLYEQDRRAPPPPYLLWLLDRLSATETTWGAVIRSAGLLYPRRYGLGLVAFNQIGVLGWKAWARDARQPGYKAGHGASTQGAT